MGFKTQNDESFRSQQGKKFMKEKTRIELRLISFQGIYFRHDEIKTYDYCVPSIRVFFRLIITYQFIFEI